MSSSTAGPTPPASRLYAGIFLAGAAVALTPWVGPPTALALGLVFGLACVHPYPAQTRRWTRVLLQASVVALGFGMNLAEIEHAGRGGFVYTALGITFAMVVGMLLGRVLRVGNTSAFLISTGTAICGG